jgi:transcription initiation factor TFIID TATA-box-binding protein
MENPIETIEIENVVASAGIGQELDLDALAEDLPEADYDPGKFPGMVYRIQSPNAATLIFRSGKIVCTGAQSTADVTEALNILFQDLHDLGIDVVAKPEITIQNIVSSGDLGEQIDLNAIAIGLGLEHTEYEPEQFPGLVYRLTSPAVVVLLFGSGKLVITGAKTRDDAQNALETVHSRLTELDLLDNPWDSLY